MKLLYVGDVMAEMGMQAVEEILPGLIEVECINFVVAQAENVTNGKGMSPDDMARLQRAGVHAFSGGNHTPYLSSLTSFLENPAEPVVGPANMLSCPGPGYKLVDSPKGIVLVVSILGSIVGKQAEVETENPLKKIDEILAAVPCESYAVSVVNLHGDFSSEKIVFGHYLDGRVTMVVGDHWHVPTADAQILPKGTAHITDVGMCGSLDSSLGVTFDSIIPRWRDGYQTRNELETSGRMQFCALLAEIDDSTGRAIHVRHIREAWEP
jgi:metallophosphoesterase (TIGR00282 family)